MSVCEYVCVFHKAKLTTQDPINTPGCEFPQGIVSGEQSGLDIFGL